MKPKIDPTLVQAETEIWAKFILARRKRKVSEWATDERIIAEGQSPLSSGRSIPYRHEVMPHAVEPMDAADDPSVNIIVLWFARRLGKTEGVCGNLIGRTVTDDPGNIYSMWPIQDSLQRFSRDVVEPMIESTPALSDVFVEKKSRDTGRTIDYKRYAGGSIYIVNAGSPSKMRGMAAKVVMLHEIDAFVASAKSEGDPIEKALGRAEGFGDAVKILESTGTIAPTIDPVTGVKVYNSRIQEWYERGDQRKWFCPCRVCGKLQWLKFNQITFPPGHPEKAFYLCERCDGSHDETQWRKMVRAGAWFPTARLTEELLKDIEANAKHARATDRMIRSYWINGFNSLLPKGKGYRTKLHQFVAEAKRVEHQPEAKRVWINEVDTSLWDPTTEGEAPPAWKPIFDRREDYGLEIPEGGLFLTAFVDCMLNRLEVGWRAFGVNEESWGMDHVVLDGHVRDKEVWQALRIELARKWKVQIRDQDKLCLAEMRLGMAFVDGGHYADDVYRFMQELARNPVPGVTGHCRASKGIGQHGHPIIDRKWRTVAKNLKGYHIGTWEAKDRIYERLRMEIISENADGRADRHGGTDEREGWYHFNKQFGEEYFQQLTVETVTITYEKGVEVRKYVNPQQQRNEALDIEVGCLAALRLHPRNLETLKIQLLASIPVAGKEGKAPAARARKRSEWLDWR